MARSYMSFKIESDPSGLSAVKNIGNKKVKGFVFPADWVTAALSFNAGATQASVKSVRKLDLSEYKVVAVAADRTVIIDPNTDPFAGCTWLQLRSGILGTAVDQTSDAVVTVLLED